MKTKIPTNHLQKSLQDLLSHYPLVQKIVAAIDKKNGRILLVGGAVRDLVLGLSTKDLDIEVYGLSMEAVEDILGLFGPVSLVGKVFGVFRLHGLNVDWSLPRADSPGRKPEVKIDPLMAYERAFARRDLTMNAMGIDMVSGELIDSFNGLSDLKNKILRTPDERFFIQDPLRFYRVMQFIGRFGMTPDDQLNQLCKTMDLSTVSRERIEEECKKLLLKSERPSLGIRWIQDIERLHELLPELFATIGVPQGLQWHPEGDVFEHTMQTIDAAAVIAREYDNKNKALVLMYAALCHDLGKVTTTIQVEDTYKSIGHAQEGVVLTKQLLRRITRNKELVDAVCKLVRYHMIPAQLVHSDAKLSAFKRLASKLASHATMQMLAHLCLADKRGRNPDGPEPLKVTHPDIDAFLARTHEAQVLEQVEKPILLGRDLLDVIEAGPEMGELLKQAYQIQLEEGIKDKEELKQRVLNLILE